MTPAEMHAEEALAEAMAHFSIDLVRASIEAYDRNDLEVAVVLANITQAAAHAMRAMSKGWDFHTALRADQW